MNSDTNTSVHSRVINAFFDTPAAARKAVDELVAGGIPRQHITETAGQDPATTATDTDENKGFWESLKDLFIPDEDRRTYAEGLRRGGYLVSVRADEANYAQVLDILDNEGSVDLDERETQWRSEGWTGSTGEGLATGSIMAAPSTTTGETTSGLVPAAPVTAERKDATPTTLGLDEDETVQLYEENLKIGERDVSHGRVRLRSYVVETPVSEQVNLRDEKVIVDRKPVDRPVAVTDALFQNRVIEAEEHAEEAVLAKEARVTEEISLRRTADTRTQTISDTIRHTEIEVEDDRRTGAAQGLTAFSAATDSSRILPHMDVISSDGEKIGTVDHLDGPDRIKLAKTTSPDGQHHMVPFTWIDHVDQHVHLKRTSAEIKADIF